MKDPYYAHIMMEIEVNLHKSDSDAKKTKNLELKDSDIKSAIRKAFGIMKGKNPEQNKENARDQWVRDLAIVIVDLGKYLELEKGISRKDYILSLLAVEDSLKTRRDFYGHSRGYLDFLKNFLAEGRLI